ncbi:FtsK/SpoIIIE domain-containing protein [Glutamicibacter arilaitensis]|uniref:FtsK/SpoIIIE domain-containing protein n=1 Tax=Glutamicibacter arilaitensis TaxID=256701 RepID=UPI003FD13667
MNEIIETLKELAQPLVENLPIILTALIVVALSFRFGLSWFIKRHQRWKNYREKRGWKPANWFRAEPKAHFEAESILLANDSIREIYAPSSTYTRDLREKESPWEWAWLSPYPRAVRSSIKRNRGMTKGKKLDARKQIAEASKHIIVLELPATERVIGNPAEHFRIDLTLDGRDPDEYRRLTGKIAAQLGLHSIKEIENMDNFKISFAAHKTEPIDPLTEQKVGASFFEENPAKTPYLVPLALRENGKPYSLAMHHTLIYGMTGAGKSSPLNGLICQYSLMVIAGTAKFYGIDPKMSEFRPLEESCLFEDLAYENTDAVEIIAEVHRLMKHRAKTKKVDVENADLGRSLEASRENPMILLFIDEMLSLLIALKEMGREGKGSITLLTEILAQGRSLGVYVIGATQEVDKELFGRMRGNFANVILLRQTSEYFNDLFLGEGARSKGYDSTAIPLSTKANGYAFAGIGYAKEETGKPVKVRFAYSSDEDIANLIKKHPKLGSVDNTDDFDDDGSFIIEDEEEAGGFNFEKLELRDNSTDTGGFGKF